MSLTSTETLCKEHVLDIANASQFDDFRGGVPENPEKSDLISKRGGARANSGGARPGAGRKPNPPQANAEPRLIGRPRNPPAAIITRPPTGLRWHVAETIPRDHETAVRDILIGNERIDRKGYDVAVPADLVRRKTRNPKRGDAEYNLVSAPMFGQRFVFVRFDEDNDDWRAIRYAEGVRRILLTSSQRPVPVERGLIEGLMATQETRLKLPLPGMGRLTPDAMVMIRPNAIGKDQFGADVYHPFAGRTAVVLACDGFTTTMRITLFGAYREVQMRRYDVVDE